MHLVNDKNLIPRCAWAVSDILNDFANIIYARCRCCVHLNHIDMTASHNIHTMKPRFGHVYIGSVLLCGLIIQCPRQNTRRGCFTHPAHTRQHEGMCNPPSFKSIAKRLHHRFLADHIVKYARAIFARQDLIGF